MNIPDILQRRRTSTMALCLMIFPHFLNGDFQFLAVPGKPGYVVFG
ncbi:MAG TPA: hypothetical protein VET88_07215 [Gammaproteobacteria bacterium]|nr:hypothetical protein [Gammaproteobacteria bacterium]